MYELGQIYRAATILLLIEVAVRLLWRLLKLPPVLAFVVVIMCTNNLTAAEIAAAAGAVVLALRWRRAWEERRQPLYH